MTEDQIERAVERKIDGADRLYCRGELSHDEYEYVISEIDAWARAEYRKMREAV